MFERLQMRIKILKKHFDKAVKRRWSGSTCLLAQASKEYEVESFFDITKRSLAAKEALLTFDKYFSRPGDEKKKALQKLRASLPIVVDL